MYLSVRSRHPSHANLRKSVKVPKRTLLRLGSTTDVSHLKPYELELNSIAGIKTSSNKFRMKQAFDAAKIPHSDWISLADNENLWKFLDKYDGKSVVLKKIYGSRNKGNSLHKIDYEFKKSLEIIEEPEKYILERYHNYAREYRLHISKNGCFHSVRKLRSSDAEERWYFNSQNGLFLLPENENFNKPVTWDNIVEDCQKASVVMSLDIAAYDVRVATDGRYIIIESNSAPSFGEVTLEKYKEELNNLCSY